MDIRDSLTEDGLNVHRMLFDRIQEIKHLSPFIDLYELNGQFFSRGLVSLLFLESVEPPLERTNTQHIKMQNRTRQHVIFLKVGQTCQRHSYWALYP